MMTENYPYDFEIKTFDCPSCKKESLTSWHTGRIKLFDLYFCKECGKKYRVDGINSNNPTFVELNTVQLDSFVEKICSEIDNADFYFTGINDSQTAISYQVTSYPLYVLFRRIDMTGDRLNPKYYFFRLEKALLNGKTINEKMEIVKKFFEDNLCKFNGFSEKSLKEIYI